MVIVAFATLHFTGETLVRYIWLAHVFPFCLRSSKTFPQKVSFLSLKYSVSRVVSVFKNGFLY